MEANGVDFIDYLNLILRAAISSIFDSDEILKSLARGTKPVTPLLAKTAQQRQHLNHLIKQIAYPVE